MPYLQVRITRGNHGLPKRIGEERRTPGGVTMQGTRSTLNRSKRGQVARVVVGVALLALLMGLWAYLWVPLVPLR